MALRFRDGRWFECEGSEPTTHILKPGVTGYDGQALDEHLSQRTAAEIGLPAAHSSLKTFGSETAIVVERYDRVTTGDGSVLRVHQEDLCQALAVDPGRKYADQGGPSTPEVIALLAQTSEGAPSNLRIFILYLLFNPKMTPKVGHYFPMPRTSFRYDSTSTLAGNL